MLMLAAWLVYRQRRRRKNKIYKTDPASSVFGGIVANDKVVGGIYDDERPSSFPTGIKFDTGIGRHSHSHSPSSPCNSNSSSLSGVSLEHPIAAARGAGGGIFCARKSLQPDSDIPSRYAQYQQQQFMPRNSSDFYRRGGNIYYASSSSNDNSPALYNNTHDLDNDYRHSSQHHQLPYNRHAQLLEEDEEEEEGYEYANEQTIKRLGIPAGIVSPNAHTGKHRLPIPSPFRESEAAVAAAAAAEQYYQQQQDERPRLAPIVEQDIYTDDDEEEDVVNGVSVDNFKLQRRRSLEDNSSGDYQASMSIFDSYVGAEEQQSLPEDLTEISMTNSVMSLQRASPILAPPIATAAVFVNPSPPPLPPLSVVSTVTNNTSSSLSGGYSPKLAPKKSISRRPATPPPAASRGSLNLLHKTTTANVQNGTTPSIIDSSPEYSVIRDFEARSANEVSLWRADVVVVIEVFENGSAFGLNRKVSRKYYRELFYLIILSSLSCRIN